MHRSASAIYLQQESIRHHVAKVSSNDFFNLLTSPALLNVVEDHLPPHRERLYHPTATLSMFLSQALNADASCQLAVNEAVVQRIRGGMKPCSIKTGGYCRARQRLPTELPRQLTQTISTVMERQLPAVWRWRNRRVKLVDGTTVGLPDTPANQAAYAQVESQRPGLGFPIARVVGITCLSTGAVVTAAIGSYKGQSELTLFRQMLGSFQRGDVLMGDAYYGSYTLICALASRGVDVVFRRHGARKSRLNAEKKLGARDHIVRWPKPAIKPNWISAEDYQALPDHLSLREIRVGRNVLVTTLLCDKETPKRALQSLYQQRWQVELSFRNIKTTLGMEVLRCKSPDMIEKELWVYLLAYNLIRLIMAEAAYRENRLPNQLSFKHALQLWVCWSRQQFLSNKAGQVDVLLAMVACHTVGNRPGRIEPRAVKRRPKPFPLLMKSRPEARSEIRKNGHTAKLK